MKKVVLSLVLVFFTTMVGASELINLIQSYQADRGALSRLYTNRLSAEYFSRMLAFNQDYLQTLQAQDYNKLSEDGKIDYVLFRNFWTNSLRSSIWIKEHSMR
jgi:uncharacterized protein (DUF885 family)